MGSYRIVGELCVPVPNNAPQWAMDNRWTARWTVSHSMSNPSSELQVIRWFSSDFKDDHFHQEKSDHLRAS